MHPRARLRCTLPLLMGAAIALAAPSARAQLPSPARTSSDRASFTVSLETGAIYESSTPAGGGPQLSPISGYAVGIGGGYGLGLYANLIGLGVGARAAASGPAASGGDRALFTWALPGIGLGYQSRSYMVGVELVPRVLAGKDYSYSLVTADIQACLLRRAFEDSRSNSFLCAFASPIVYSSGAQSFFDGGRWLDGVAYGLRAVY
jgi:hypothetical protein